MIFESEQEAAQQLQAAGQYLAENDLTWGNSGNLSVRLSEKNSLITASGTNLGSLGVDDFVAYPLQGKIDRSGEKIPSKETPMHRAVYKQRPEINAVLHVSPMYSTLISCSKINLPKDWFVEDMYYLERVARVAYAHPGSEELGANVYQQAPKANVLLLENHGVLTYDVSLDEALMAVHTLETVSRMALLARSAELPMHPLSTEQVTSFLQESGYREPREWSV
jgi:L-fuculose-phosphate aldolase